MAKIEVSLSTKDIKAIAVGVAKELKSEAGMPETYTVTEVADITKVHKNTILNHIRDGLLDATKQGKSYIITKQSLTKYLQL